MERADCRIGNMLHELSESCRVENECRHEKVIRNLPFNVETEREFLEVFSRIVPARDGQYVVLRWQACIGQLRDPKEVRFKTDAWIRFLRMLGPSCVTNRSFSVKEKDQTEYFWRYSVRVHPEKDVVELMSSFRTSAWSALGPERDVSSIPMSLDLWQLFRQRVRLPVTRAEYWV